MTTQKPVPSWALTTHLVRTFPIQLFYEHFGTNKSTWTCTCTEILVRLILPTPFYWPFWKKLSRPTFERIFWYDWFQSFLYGRFGMSQPEPFSLHPTSSGILVRRKHNGRRTKPYFEKQYILVPWLINVYGGINGQIQKNWNDSPEKMSRARFIFTPADFWSKIITAVVLAVTTKPFYVHFI